MLKRPMMFEANLGTFDEEILHYHYQQITRIPIPLFLLAMVIWGMAVQHLPNLWPSVWLCFVVLVFALRWAIEIKWSRFRSMSTDKRLRASVALSMLSGISQGLSLFFFLDLTESERAIQSMLFIGLAAGAAGTMAAYWPCSWVCYPHANTVIFALGH